MRGGWRGLQGLKTEKEMWWGLGGVGGKKTRRYNRNGAAVGAEGLPVTPPPKIVRRKGKGVAGTVDTGGGGSLGGVKACVAPSLHH